MIRVNLIGGSKKAAGGKKGFGLLLSTNLLPIVWAGVFVGAAVIGYMWWSGLKSEIDSLDTDIAAAMADRDDLRSVIAENERFEARQVDLQDRVNTIRDLEQNQVSPVVVLDQLSLAVGAVDYIWLTTLQQNNTELNMAGNGTSQIAVADFITSLENTGYFTNIRLGNLQEGAGGLWVFNMSCEFVPPLLPVEDSADPADADAGGSDADQDGNDADSEQ